MTQKFSSQEIYHTYEYYKEASVTNKRLKHHDLVRKIDDLNKKDIFKSNIIGNEPILSVVQITTSQSHSKLLRRHSQYVNMPVKIFRKKI